MVRLNLCKTLGIKLLSSLSGRRKLCVLGLRLERLEITGGKWGRRTCSAFRTTAIKRPLSAPSISASISTLSSATQPAISSLRQNRSIFSLSWALVNPHQAGPACSISGSNRNVPSVKVYTVAHKNDTGSGVNHGGGQGGTVSFKVLSGGTAVLTVPPKFKLRSDTAESCFVRSHKMYITYYNVESAIVKLQLPLCILTSGESREDSSPLTKPFIKLKSLI